MDIFIKNNQKKTFIILYLILIVNVSFSQHAQKVIFSCEDLNAIFSNPYFAKGFLRSVKDTVIFVDTFKVFSRCNTLLIHGQPVVFLDKLTKEISDGAESARHFNKERMTIPFTKRYIVVEFVKRKNKQSYDLAFWQPQNNVDWRFYFYRRKKPKIKIYEAGQY
jgi:hypothetical protein